MRPRPDGRPSASLRFLVVVLVMLLGTQVASAGAVPGTDHSTDLDAGGEPATPDQVVADAVATGTSDQGATDHRPLVERERTAADRTPALDRGDAVIGPGSADAREGDDDDGLRENGDFESRRVRLITGETLEISRRDGELAVEAVEGGSVGIVEGSGETYLLPDRVDLTTYDRSLFAVETLLAGEESSGRIHVLLDANASSGSTNRLGDPQETSNRSGLRDVRYLESAGVYAATVDPEEGAETVEELVADGVVERVSVDGVVDRPPRVSLPSTTSSGDREVTGEGVTVAVLDTGIDATHPDLAGSVVDRVDLVADGGGDGTGDDVDRPLDPHGHGTIVAGILAGSGGGDDAHDGMAPGADLVDARVMDARGRGRASTIVEGLEYAVEADVDVALMSIGTSVDGSEEIAESVAWATERGVVVVAAAGNKGKPRSIGAPGRPDDAITVGAIDADGAVASYSSRGPTLDGRLKPDLVAPGAGIVGPRASGSGRVAIDAAGRYTRSSGTSVAAPQVAGAAALLLEAEPGLSPLEIENRLASTARPVDGPHSYAHGSGVLDVDRALEPTVVATASVIDFGLVEVDETRNRSITLTNHDDRRHDLSLATTVQNVDVDQEADGTVRLNRTRLTLGPGERATVSLTIDGNTTSGAHAGTIRYTVDGEPRSIAFGFVRGGTVTVEKRPLTAGDRVDGDELWVLTEEGTHDELLEFENGSATFVAGGGTYVLWSTGYDEASDTTVFLSERRVVDGPTHVVLDESDTVPVGVDVGAVEDWYGRLATRSLVASMSTEYAGGLARRSVSRMNVDGRAIRVSRDPELDVAATFLLTTGSERSSDLDVSDVFQLAQGVEGVREASVVEVEPGDLTTTEHRYYRTTVDETYRARDRAVLSDVWNSRSTRWFDLGGRTTQRIHRLPGAADYERRLQGTGWRAEPGDRVSPSGSVDVLAHPLLGLLDVDYVANGTLAVTATPFSDGSGTRFDPDGRHTVTAVVDGEVVREGRVVGGVASLDGLPIERGDPVTVRLVGNNSEGHLSTRTLTEVRLPGYAPPETRDVVVTDRPPTVTDVAVSDEDAYNAVASDVVRVAFDVDLVGTIAERTVWYSVASPEEPPWENGSAWIRADSEKSGDRIDATLDVGEDAKRVSVAVELSDIWGRSTRTMTVDGVHVGAAPNTSTSMIVGTFVAADGTPAANDTIVMEPVDGGSARYVRTDEAGRIEVEVPRTRRYDLTYLRGEPWGPRTPVDDDRPAWLPLERVNAADGVDLGVRTLPPARELMVHVTDERGESVGGATVRVSQERGNISVSDVLGTNENGLAVDRGRLEPGIQLAGTVNVTVEPPDDDVHTPGVHRYTLTLDEPRTLDVTLETRPPSAAIAAFGTFEPGSVVFVHARRSEVPAGVAEYRWDLDGDGTPEHVTDEPIVRYVPDESTLQPTVTVVDEAGKTDAATMTIPLDGG